MKLASFEHDGKRSFGLITTHGVVDLGKRLGAKATSLRALLADPEAWRTAEAAAREGTSDYPVGEIRWLPVITDPEKIICVGVNYVSHRDETGRSESKYPVLFTRFANTQVGHQQPLILPRVSTSFDFEGELAVIIGKPARHVKAEHALDFVAGYSIYQDATVRDWQAHTPQFTPGKNFVGTGGLGPWLVSADELGDPSALTLTTRVNGTQMQHSTTDLLIFSVPKLIEYISTFTELVPGDVIATGTPGGVGFKRNPPVFLKVGDVVEVEISRVGTLRNAVVAEQQAH